MGSGVPLLNEYKQEFFLKRLPQTILGGLKIKLGYEAPFYVYVSQIVLFVVPWLLGGIFTALVEYDVLTFDLGAYVYGSLMFLLVLGCQILSTVMASQRSKSVLVKEKPSLLAEEDEVDFFSCCGPETVSFVIVPKKHKLNILLHSAVSGLMCGVGLWYLLPKTLNSLYNFNVGATVILYTLGWLTLCISQYPLTSCAPPEPARYRALDTYELSSLVRPFYMMVCQAFFIAAKYMGMTELMLADQILHVVFVCLPVVWTLGLLPPLDALLFWAVEQFSVLFLGGSPTSTDVWSVVMVFVSVGALLAVHFIPVCSASVVVAAVFGYVLSIDLGGYVSSLFPACRKKNRVSSSEYHNPSEQKLRSFSWGKLILYFLYHFIMAGSAVAISLCLLLYKNSLHPDSWRIMGYVVVGLLVLEKFLRDFQGVYVVFGLWHNPLFCYHSVYRKQLFRRRKKLGHILLLILGVLRRAIVNFVAPVVMLSYLCLAGGFVSAVTTVSCHSGRTISAAAWLSISINRAFRSVWQSTVDALLEISIAHIIMIALPSVMADQSLGLFNLLLIISFARDRFYQILDKLWFYFTLLIMAWKDKKQRRRSSLAIILMNVLLFPVVLGVVVVSAALSAPLLPLFTLPIFLMGFPRPVRSWPSAVGASANQCPDTVFYKQLTRNLTTAMKAAFANGSLGEPRPGSHYLLRFQDRMIWVMVLERGSAYCRLSIKGLELQETSCHSVEATRVDDMFDSTFESETGFPLCSFNQYPLHTLTPCDTLSLKTYSDARNILTGIIDSPDNHKFVFAVFPKVLVWVLLKEVFKINLKKNERTNSENNLDELKQISRKDSWSNNNNKEFSPKDTVVTIGASNTFRGVSPSPIVQELDDYEWADSRPNSARAASRKPSLSDSFQSFTSILSNDDHPIEMNRVKPVSKKKSSRANVRKSSDSIEELGFGLPAVDPRTKPKSPHSVPFQVSGKAGNSIYRPVTNLAGSAEFTTPHSRQLSLPAKWRELPVEESRVRKMSADFPADWYRGLIATLGLSAAHLASENVAAEVAKDDVLLTIYSQLTMACCGVFDPSGGGGGTSHLYKCYRGDVPWNAMLDWLTEDKTLFGLVLQAYRYSFKLMLDQCVLGEITDDSELVEYLEEYDSDWYIGLDSDPEWNTAVLNNKPSLFSVGHASHQGTYSSRVVTLQDTAVHVGRLNAEAVRGQWANLSLELLYFTNDDEERYSIQAHPALLRNLTVQAADPPLGYPIFSSAPTSLSLL